MHVCVSRSSSVWLQLVSGMYYSLQNICTYPHFPREPQRKEIAVGTQFISRHPPAKCWQTIPDHNPHVVNHDFTSLGSMWFWRQRLRVYIPRCHMHAVSGQLWTLYMYMATNHYRLMTGWWIWSPANSPYASLYSKMSSKKICSILTEKWEASIFCGTAEQEATMVDGGPDRQLFLSSLHIQKTNGRKENSLQSKCSGHWGLLRCG